MICEKCIHSSVCKYGELRSNGMYCTGEECKQFREIENWDREEVWDAIHELSDIRARYNLFNAKQRPKYHACSLGIKALREVINEPCE